MARLIDADKLYQLVKDDMLESSFYKESGVE